MKHSLRIALALLVIAALGLGMFAMAEGVVEPETIEGIEGLENEVEIENDDMGELNLALGDLVSEGPEAPATAVYRFIVNETEYQVQQVRDGAAVLLPENPAVPEGMAFEAWVLESGAPLFVDADGNGEIDPVIANAEAQPEVKVWASFKQVEVQSTEEQPADEEPTDDQPTEGTPEPSPATEGSDSGEGGAAAPEEVVPQAGATTGDETEGETTSSVSPDGEPASPEGEALDAPAEEESTEEQPAEEQLVEEQPTEEEQSTEEEPTEEEQPAEEQPIEEAQSTEEVQPAEEEQLAEEQPTEEEPTEEEPTEEAPVEEEPIEESAEEEPVEEQPAEEQSTEEAPVAEEAAEDQPTAVPVANALVYTGEAQALVSGEGWLYSLDGETYSADIPTAVDAGDYTVYYKTAEDAEAQTMTVTVAKADVVLVPPEAMNGVA